jgi:hypothetical protein
MLLAFAIAVFLGSESLGTLDHILLSYDSQWSLAEVELKLTGLVEAGLL